MKKNIKILLLALLVSITAFAGKKTFAAGTYSDEGIAFYAQASSSGYASEGIAFYAYDPQVSKPSSTVNVYRFYNTSTGDHLYTASEDEKNTINNNPQWGYNIEGIAFYAYDSQLPKPDGAINIYRFYNSSTGNHFYTASENEKISISQVPIYRFYNPNSGDHFYTASENEKSILANTNKSGYLIEGVAFYAYNSQITNTLPVYRFFNSANGDHFYTISEDEKKSLIDNPQWGYSYENIAFYTYNSQLIGSLPIYRFYNSTNSDHLYTISLDEKNRILTPALGPEISVGLWYYSKTDLQNSNFQIDANKQYNIRNSSGNILAQAGGSSTTNVSYNDKQNQLTVTQGNLNQVLAGTNITFDAADGDNSTLRFNTHRSNYVPSDWRGKINNYRGKIKIQYYRGYDIAGGAAPGSADVTQIWVDNIVPLEQYAWGSAETSGTGNLNHTEVMSTIFRTYGFWYIKYANKYSPLGFKIRSDSGSQNYGGYDWETAHPNVKIAAQNTRGVIATYANDVAITPYSSWSDGRTRSWQEKWGGNDYPWCQSVSDPYGKNVAQSGGSHMVGLIANGSLNLATNYGWDWQRILHY